MEELLFRTDGGTRDLKGFSRGRVCSPDCVRTIGGDWSSLPDVVMRTVAAAQLPKCVMDGGWVPVGGELEQSTDWSKALKTHGG